MPRDEPAGSALDQLALGLERQQPGRIGQRDPAHLGELAVVAGKVAADRLHQPEVDRLVDLRAALHELVLDPVDRGHDAHVQPGLLGNLAKRRLLEGLGRIRGSLGERPRAPITLATAAAGDEMRNAGDAADDDPARGSGGGVPQPRHGADAARTRRP